LVVAHFDCQYHNQEFARNALKADLSVGSQLR